MDLAHGAIFNGVLWNFVVVIWNAEGYKAFPTTDHNMYRIGMMIKIVV